MNANTTDTGRTEDSGTRFEDRLLASILTDFDELTAGPGPVARATPPRRRRWRPRVRLAVPALAAVAAAAAVVVVVVAGSHTPGSGPENVRAAGAPHAAIAPHAENVLYRLASDSAAAAALSGRYLILTETETDSALAGQTESRTDVDDTQTGADTFYSSPLTGSDAGDGPRSFVAPEPFLYPESWYASLPTDPTALRPELAPIGAVVVSAQLGSSAPSGVVVAAEHHGAAPADLGSPAVREDDVYEAASDLLWSPLAPPALRSALYAVLATTSGVTVNTQGDDPSGRPAIAMSRSYSQDGAQLQSTTYENPTTGAVLAQTISEQGANASAPQTSTAIYQPVTSADSIPADPYGN